MIVAPTPSWREDVVWRLRNSLDLSNVSAGSVVTKNSPLRREQNVKQVLKPVSTIVTVEPDICEHYT